MNEHAELHEIAWKSELKSSRRLAAASGITEHEALRKTLGAIAGKAGLAALIAARVALRQAAADRLRAREQSRAALEAARKTRHAGAATAWRAWFDGSAHPNPGRCGIGALLLGPGGERIEISRPAGYGNSSEAEYMALIALLQAAVASSSHDLSICGDSQVVVNDMNGPEAMAAASLRAYRTEARALLAQLRGVTLRWIPRHKNGEADVLSQRGAARETAEI